MKRITIAVLTALACGVATAGQLGAPFQQTTPSGPRTVPIFGNTSPKEPAIPGPRVGPMGGPFLSPPVTSPVNRPTLGSPMPPSSPSPPRLR